MIFPHESPSREWVGCVELSRGLLSWAKCHALVLVMQCLQTPEFPFTHFPCRLSRLAWLTLARLLKLSPLGQQTNTHACWEQGSSGGCENTCREHCSVKCKKITVSYRAQLKVVFFIVHSGRVSKINPNWTRGILLWLRHISDTPTLLTLDGDVQVPQ